MSRRRAVRVILSLVLGLAAVGVLLVALALLAVHLGAPPAGKWAEFATPSARSGERDTHQQAKAGEYHG